jgi:hypothetical protein
MTSLSPHGRAVLEGARRALHPTAADRERVANALRARLGPQVLAPDLSSGLSPVAAGLHIIPVATTAACLLGGVLLLALGLRASMPARIANPRQARVVEVPTSPHTSAPDEPAQVVSPLYAALPPQDARRPRQAVLRKHDSLAQEVSLLSRATSAVKAGRPNDALRAVDAHEQRFQHGLLGQERRAAKAQALCLLGRVAEGRAEIAHLTSGSPAASRAQEVCDGASSRAAALPHGAAGREVP